MASRSGNSSSSTFIKQEVTAVYNQVGRCMALLLPDRAARLYMSYMSAKQAGMHTNIQPPVEDFATEMKGLVERDAALHPLV